MDRFPPVIRILLIGNALVFLAQGAGDLWYWLLEWFALWPVGSNRVSTGVGLADVPSFMPWQLVSYGFLHANFLHLAFNMFALWMFGSDIEYLWGSRPFAFYYFTCVIGAGLVQLVVATMAAAQGAVYPTIGASGGVFGVLLAFAMMFPDRPVMLLFPPIPMKAKWLVIGYGAIELYLGVTRSGAGVAHFAHLGGMAFGFLLIQYWRGKLPWQPRRRLNR